MTKHIDATDRYFITSQYSGGDYFIERGMADMSLRETVDDIASGQIMDVVRVYRANLADGTFRDASEDVARDILNIICVKYDSPDEIETSLVDFLEHHLGAGILDREMTGSRSDYAEHNTLNRAQQGV